MTRKQREWQEAGLCYRCGASLTDEHKSCSACREKDRARRQAKKDAGICMNCNYPAAEGHTLCEVCLEKERKRAEKANARKRTEHLCTQCGAPTSNGRKLCEKCTAGYREKYWERRRNGLCIRCGRPSAGKSRCPVCAAAHVDIELNRVSLCRLHGVCARCGKPAETVYCQECSRKRKQRKQQNLNAQV